MKEMLQNSVFFGVMISIFTYLIGVKLKQRFQMAILNPLLIAFVLTSVVLLSLNISYESYNEGAKYLSYLLTPATVCLSISLYEQAELLKNNWKAVTVGIVSGVLTSLTCILAMCLLFKMGHAEYVTLLPKSITTAIGIGVSEELGGYATITASVIIITGILGNMMAEGVCKIFRIKHPIAKGIAIGTASHAIGTAKAMELGEIEGAMSSLSIAVSGLLTVVGASVFAQFL